MPRGRQANATGGAGYNGHLAGRNYACIVTHRRGLQFGRWPPTMDAGSKLVKRTNSRGLTGSLKLG